MELKFYICENCGNIVAKIKDSGVPVMCCGQKMTEIKAGTTDAAVEKHVPVVKVEGSKVYVTVGEVAHPMAPEHRLAEWQQAEWPLYFNLKYRTQSYSKIPCNASEMFMRFP